MAGQNRSYIKDAREVWNKSGAGFIAKMLFFLPDHHQKMIRYYGIYAQSKREKLAIIEKSKWSEAIEHSFNKNPESCPDCGSNMILTIIYSNFSEFYMRRIRKTHILAEGAAYGHPCPRGITHVLWVIFQVNQGSMRL